MIEPLGPRQAGKRIGKGSENLCAKVGVGLFGLAAGIEDAGYFPPPRTRTPNRAR